MQNEKKPNSSTIKKQLTPVEFVENLLDKVQLSENDYDFLKLVLWEAKSMEKEQMGYSKEKVDKLIDTLYNNNMCSIAGDELIETFKSE